MTTVPTPEPKGYAVTAAELRRIADALDTLPPGDKPPYVQLSILPDTAEAVDAVALAVLGKPGQGQRIGDDWYHIVRGGGGKTGVYVTVQTTVPGPPDERDAEIERLRSELAEARAATETARSFLGTEGAVAEPKPDPLVVAHGRASVPDMVTRYFSFGHGQTDPDTGESLLDKYATVIAPTVEACRAAMFASRYGNRWSFDYAPDDPKWTEWGPQWTEHDRIVASVPDMQTRPTSCLAVLSNGVRCNEPLEWDDMGWWVHTDETGIDHPAVGPDRDGDISICRAAVLGGYMCEAVIRRGEDGVWRHATEPAGHPAVGPAPQCSPECEARWPVVFDGTPYTHLDDCPAVDRKQIGGE